MLRGWNMALLWLLLLCVLSWQSAAGLQCYYCDGFATASCQHADKTNTWGTCDDPGGMCLTGIGFATYMTLPMTIVLRGCNNSIPADYLSRIPATDRPTPDRCDHFILKYLVKHVGFIVPINVTVCPCTTRLCNAGSITVGGTAATASPPSTISPPPTSTSSIPPALTNPTVQSSSDGRTTTTHNGGPFVSHANNSDTSVTTVKSVVMTSNSQNHPGFLIAAFLAAILGRHHIN